MSRPLRVEHAVKLAVSGKNSVIDQNVTIGDSVLLKNVHIKTSTKVLSSCVIGDEGIGAVRDENNKLVEYRSSAGLNYIIEDV